jgi:transposase-like protein
MSSSKGRDVEKERYWEKVVREAARSGLSIREYCRQHDLKESQFHWWQRKLKDRRQERRLRRQRGSGGSEASFALVSEGAEDLDAGLELVLGNGCRLRIRKGVDEQTLRTVLAAMGPQGC